MNAILAIILISPVAALVAAAVVAVMRASDTTIDHAVMLIAGGFAVVLLGVAVRIVLEGKASIRQAQFPKPSHQIDNRTQNIDARRQIAVVDAAGRTVELPAGQKIVEVMR